MGYVLHGDCFVEGLGIFEVFLMQVVFCTHEDLHSFGTLFLDLGEPLIDGIMERVLINHGETYEKHISFLIGYESELFVFLLACSIPEPKFNHVVTHFNIRHIVIKDCGDIVGGEIVGSVTDQHGGLANAAITH